MTTLTQEKSVSTGNQKIFTVICHINEKPREYSITANGFIKSLMVALAIWMAFPYMEDGVVQWDKQRKADSLRPKMEMLADQGKNDASLWLIRTYWESNKHRLAPLVAKGIPEAMFVQGLTQLKSDKTGAMRWIEKAADSGYVDAIKFIEIEQKR